VIPFSVPKIQVKSGPEILRAGKALMKKFVILALLFASTCLLRAQTVDTTVCNVLKSPASFNGKIVRIKGTVTAGFDVFAIKDPSCGQKLNAIWLSYPEGTKGKAGPVATLILQPAKNFAGAVSAADRKPVSLERNKDFKQFDQLLSTPAKTSGMCLGCVRYDVTAMLVGRLDGTAPGIQRDASGKIVAISGFGNLNAYSARLVLQSAADVTSVEIDYSKPPASTQNGDTIDHEFGSGTPVPNQPKRAIAAFGKEGDDNGVELTGTPDETTENQESKASANSPDGVLYNCHFDFDRSKGDAMTVAMAHLGMHIADIRNPEGGADLAGPYQLEFRAWVTTVIGAISTGQKTVMLPGGYRIYDASWPKTDLVTNTQGAVSSYLADGAMLSQ
jgi:hypothetical protein